MSSTYTSLHYHIVFSTKNRTPSLAKPWRGKLHAYMGGIVKGLGAHPCAIGGIDDHVHLLVDLTSSHCLKDFVRDLKVSSSKWLSENTDVREFHWQTGYAAFTVSPTGIDGVRGYIAHQETHHQVQSSVEELKEMLEKAEIKYDPRYLD